jgi:hypothetical protein
MVEVDHLILAVANGYKYKNQGKVVTNHDYDNTVGVARAVWGHQRVRMPYGLTVLGY